MDAYLQVSANQKGRCHQLFIESYSHVSFEARTTQKALGHKSELLRSPQNT